jgi:hypothetical protein
VFRFIIEYSSLMDFGPQVVGLFLYEDFQKMIFWLVLKLEISYRVTISWRILVSYRRFLNFHNSSLQCDTPLVCLNKLKKHLLTW